MRKATIHCVAHVHFYAGMYGEFAVCFFAVDQHVHAQVTGIDVSVYLPDRLSDSFFQLLEFVSEVSTKKLSRYVCSPNTFPE